MKPKSIAFLIFAALAGAVLRADEPATGEPLDFVVESVVVEDTCQNPLINTAPTKEGWRITKEKIQVNGKDWVYGGAPGSEPNFYGTSYHEMQIDLCKLTDGKSVSIVRNDKFISGNIIEEYWEGMENKNPACIRIFKEWPCTITRKFTGKTLE